MRRYLKSTSDAGVDWRRVWRLLVVCVALAVTVVGVWTADAGYDRACTLEELRVRRAGICGSRLVDLLRVVCRSCYNKRSADCESAASFGR